MERILSRRLEAFLGEKGFSDRQFGFWKGRSTIDAIEMLMTTAKDAISGKRWLEARSSHWMLRTDLTLRLRMSHWLPLMLRTYRATYWS